jgi:hypothetical protein
VNLTLFQGSARVLALIRQSPFFPDARDIMTCAHFKMDKPAIVHPANYAACAGLACARRIGCIHWMRIVNTHFRGSTQE